ncbi:MAG TPA: hypothetical protein VGP27_00320 [Mycobacterium sp.]|nr:hypothetical protein [Mycobacterium sp.]
MDSEQLIRIALTVVTPILTAGIGIVALVIGDWRERRTQAGRRKISFEDASRQVEFAADWYKASREIAPDQEQQAAARAQVWLDEASDLVAESKPPPRSQKRSVTARRLLLAYPMHRRGARVLRGFYYFFLGVVVLQVSGALGSAFGRTDTLGVPNYFSGGLIYADLLGIVVYTLVAMAFRFWALRAEESLTADAPQRRMTVRDALLLCRLTGVGANIARIVYWFWLALIVLAVVAIAISASHDPRTLPSNVVALVAWAGWAVGLRYWAVSHSGRAAGASPGAGC